MSLVVGIDIGNENCVVSAINKNGVADVVLNEASKRETPLLIHFDKKQRFFGSAGASYASRNPKATFTQIKRLIGRRFDEPSFQNERPLLPYDTSPGPNGEIVVGVNFAGQQWKFTAVELLGMFLCHLKKSVQKITDSQISECVLGVPSYLTIQQRKDYLLAAEIAGLKPLRLFHDGAATALEYALSRDLPYGEAIHVVFVDIGHCDTQVTVAKFCLGALTVLAHSFDRDLGGRNFDNKIFEHLVGVILQKHPIDVRADVKASFRLRAKCAEAKKVLSVNTEASVSIECLMNDIDVEETITREDFEKMSYDLLLRVVSVCKKALKDAGLPKEVIHSIELVGSGSRIPKVSQFLEEFFQQKTRRTLNGSECIANGCALQCAMLGQVPLTIRTYGVRDIFPYSLGYRLDKCDSVEPSKIFARGQFFLDAESLSLHPSCQNITFEYADSTELPCDASKSITHCKISDVAGNQKHCVEVRFQINIHGILSILSASLVNKHPIEHEAIMNSEPMETDDAKEGTETAKDEASSPILARTDHTFEIVMVQGLPTGREAERKLEVISHSDFRVVEAVQAKETELERCDGANERAKHQRNMLEASLFRFRSMVLGKSVTLASEENKKFFLTELENIEEWLYELGTDETEETYDEKLSFLNSAYRGLSEEHEMACQMADDEKKRLFSYAKPYWEKLCSGRLSLTNEEHGLLKGLLLGIKELMMEHSLRPQEEYRKKTEELKKIVDTIKNHSKFEAAEKSKGSRLLSVGKRVLSALTGPSQEYLDIDGRETVTPTSEPSAANSTDMAPNRDDLVKLDPTVEPSSPGKTDQTEIMDQAEPLTASTRITYPEIRDGDTILYQPQSENAPARSESVNEQKNSNNAKMLRREASLSGSIRSTGNQNNYTEIANINEGGTPENVSSSLAKKNLNHTGYIGQTDRREINYHAASSNQIRKNLFLCGTSGNVSVDCGEEVSIADLKNQVLAVKEKKPTKITNYYGVVYKDDRTLKSIGFKSGKKLYYHFY